MSTCSSPSQRKPSSAARDWATELQILTRFSTRQYKSRFTKWNWKKYSRDKFSGSDCENKPEFSNRKGSPRRHSSKHHNTRDRRISDRPTSVYPLPAGQGSVEQSTVYGGQGNSTFTSLPYPSQYQPSAQQIYPGSYPQPHDGSGGGGGGGGYNNYSLSTGPVLLGPNSPRSSSDSVSPEPFSAASPGSATCINQDDLAYMDYKNSNKRLMKIPRNIWELQIHEALVNNNSLQHGRENGLLFGADDGSGWNGQDGGGFAEDVVYQEGRVKVELGEMSGGYDMPVGCFVAGRYCGDMKVRLLFCLLFFEIPGLETAFLSLYETHGPEANDTTRRTKTSLSRWSNHATTTLPVAATTKSKSFPPLETNQTTHSLPAKPLSYFAQ